MQIAIPPLEERICVDVFFWIVEQLQVITGADVMIPAISMQALIGSVLAYVFGPGAGYGPITVGAGHLAGAVKRNF